MKRRFSSERGATLVESALTISLFFALAFGAVEFGRAFSVYQVSTDAAREGARFASAPAPGTSTLPSTAQIQQVVTNYLAAGAVTGGTVDVSQVTDTYNNLTIGQTRVLVSVPYQFYFFPFGTITLQTQSVMRNETSPT